MVIGLDAATLALVRPWAVEGRLPHLADVMRRGVAAPLSSTLPPASPAAWSSFITGTGPGKHGVIQFYQFGTDRYEPHLVNARRRHGEAFWEIAGRQGVEGGIINVPVTYPPRAFNGFIVGGLLSPGLNRGAVSPPDVLDDLLAASPDYRTDVSIVKKRGTASRLRCLETARRTVRARLAAALGLYRKRRPQLFCVVFVAADRIGHFFWQDWEALRDGRARTKAERLLGEGLRSVYEELDRAVGALIEEAGPDTDVLILSDHGACALHKGLSLRRLLAEHGLLVERRSCLLRRWRRRALRGVARRLPLALKSRLKARLPGLMRRSAGAVAFEGIDFERSRAYPAGNADGVFVNLKGRQPQGAVEPGAEYEAVRDEIIDALTGLEDPATGRAIVTSARRREEVWSGPQVERLPDVVIEAMDRSYQIPSFPTETPPRPVYDLPAPDPRRWLCLGAHEPEGLLMAVGPHIKKAAVRDAKIEDVPATVLALLGCAIPDRFDGRVLTEMLTDDVGPVRVTRAGSEDAGGGEDVFSDADQDAVTRRLQDLGYV